MERLKLVMEFLRWPQSSPRKSLAEPTVLTGAKRSFDSVADRFANGYFAQDDIEIA